MIIDTERLILRPILFSDATDIFEYSKEEGVGPNAGWAPHKDLEATVAVIETVFFGQDMVWGIVFKENGKMIGSVGLIEDQKRENARVKMLGYAMGQAYWGRGIMSEAVQGVLDYGFGERNLALISAYCYSFNQRSKNLLKKLGFIYEGTLSLAEELYDGQIYDYECFALPRNQHQSKSAPTT